MKEALKGIFGSKKALTGIAATITTALILFAQKQGYGLDPEATKLLVGAVLGLAGTYIIGQGVSDHGKEKAKVEQAGMEVNVSAQGLPEDAGELPEASTPGVLTEDA